MPELEVLWAESGSLTEIPDQFSPDQVSPSYFRKFTSPQVPNALVAVYAYVIREDEDLANSTWNVEFQVKHMVGTDPADIIGTQTWSDSAYTKGSLNGEPLISYQNAWGDAGYRIEMFHEEEITWNGQAA